MIKSFHLLDGFSKYCKVLVNINSNILMHFRLGKYAKHKIRIRKKKENDDDSLVKREKIIFSRSKLTIYLIQKYLSIKLKCYFKF